MKDWKHLIGSHQLGEELKGLRPQLSPERQSRLLGISRSGSQGLILNQPLFVGGQRISHPIVLAAVATTHTSCEQLNKEVER